MILDAIFNCLISMAGIISHAKYANLDETLKSSKLQLSVHWVITHTANQIKLYACICDLTSLIGYVNNKSLWLMQ